MRKTKTIHMQTQLTQVLKLKYKEKFLQAAREKQFITYKVSLIRLTTDLLSGTKRSESRVRLHIHSDESKMRVKKRFPDKEKQKEFILTDFP